MERCISLGRDKWEGEERGGEPQGEEGRIDAFGGVASFVLAEPCQVFVLEPGHGGVVSGVVLLFEPF